MGKLERLVVHASDTPPTMHVTPEMIDQWHMSPKDLKDGKVKYLGKTYASRDALPNDYINGVSIKKLHGRGWDRRGYADMMHRDGTVENITPYDNDDWVSNDEMTWGASGVNSTSRHIMLEGGRHGDFNDDFFEHYTDAMFTGLASYIKDFLKKHPDAKVTGHNDHSYKPCPCFSVKEFLRMHGMEEYYGGED